jgi:hypothetical protein
MFLVVDDLPPATVTSPACRSGIIAGMSETPAEDVPQTLAAFNGHSTPARQTAEGVAEIATALAQFPQVLAAVLRQVQVQTRQHLCAQCLIVRIGWEALHGRELKAAIAAAGAAFGLPEGDPRAGQLDPAPHLPPDLKPGGPQGIPPLTAAVTTVGGTEVCSEHIPGRPGSQKLLIATGALSASALAGLG